MHNTKLAVILMMMVAAFMLGSRSARAADPEVIHTVLEGLPGVVDEGHLDTVALGIAHAADRLTSCYPTEEKPVCRPEWVWGRTELVAAMITLGYWESRFLRRIGAGKCHPWECDPSKMRNGAIVHRARGFYQVQNTGSITAAQWRSMLGITYDAQVTAAEVAGRVMALKRGQCKTRLGMISGYARGIGCSWRGAAVRERFMARVIDRISAAESVRAQKVNGPES